MLAAFAAEVSAVDVDSDAIALARILYKNLGSVSFQVGDIRHLPFENGLFDAVVSFGPLDQTGNPEDLINEARRVLKPDGLLIVSLTTAHRSAPSEDGTPPPSDAANTEAWTKRLSEGFSNLAVYGQRMVSASSISPMKATPTAPNVAEYRAYRTTNHGGARPKASPGVVRFGDPTSLICVASNAPIPHISGPDSMFLMDSIDLWTMQSEVNHQPSGLQIDDVEQGAIASLTRALQQARSRIEALMEARDSLERAIAGQTEAHGSVNTIDLSVIGPMMEELAGQPIPADIPNLVRLLGQVAVRSAQQEIRLSDLERLQVRMEALQADLDHQTTLARETQARHEAAIILAHETAASLSQASEEIATLTATKQALILDLEDISTDAEAQVKILRASAVTAQENAVTLASQAHQQSVLLTEILQDLAEMTDRETATSQANLALAAEKDDLQAQLTLSRQTEGEFAAERHLLGTQLAEFEQSLISSETARRALEDSLLELNASKQTADHQNATALADLAETMTREHAAQIEIVQGGFAGERHALGSRLAEMESSLTASQAFTRAAEQNLAELIDLKQIAEHNAAAARAELRRSEEREQAAQAEILRRADTETQLAETWRQTATDLAIAQDTISRQVEEISGLANTGRLISADFDATRQAFAQQAVEISDLQAAAAVYQMDLQTVNNSVLILNAKVLEMAAAERALLAEKEAWKAALEHWEVERDAWHSERQTWIDEREIWANETGRSARECEGLRFELNAIAAQRDLWEAEMRVWHVEKQAWNSERDAHHTEREAWIDERNSLTLALSETSQKLADQAAQLQPPAWWTRFGNLGGKGPGGGKSG